MYANKFQTWYVVALMLGFGFFPTRSDAQRRVHSMDDSIRYERDFLQVFYPELSGKKYAMTIETANRYDESDNTDRLFLVDIGDGAKYAELGCCLGGEMGSVILPRLPDDKELGPHPPLPSAPSPPKPTNQRRLNVDARGAIHPFQYLSSVFVFDSQGRLKNFSARRNAALASDSVTRFWEKVQNHPEMTDEELTAAYKESGAKYTIGDTEAFKRDLPLNKLEQFLGKFEIIKMEFNSTTEKHMDKLGAFSGCSLLLQTSSGGTPLQYQAYFEATRGALDSLFVVEDRDGASTPKMPK
jgi:hypothetical protein